MIRTRLHAPEAQPVTFVELFFDLVFVFAVTQVTVLTAHHLDAGGIARSLLLFWLIWWAWTQFTWTLSPADTEHTVVRAMTLVATGLAFVMATAIPRAFEGDPLWFAVPYVLIRAIGIGLQVRVDQEQASGGSRMSTLWVSLSSLGLVVVLGGALVDPSARTWVWLGALVIDLVASALASRDAEWDLDPRHFAERHGLFVIIALGESLIVAGTAVAEERPTADLVLVAGAALVVACLLWWTYFGWLKEAMESRFTAAPPAQIGTLARDAYSLSHFPLVCGIIGFAVAVEEIVLHPDEPAKGAVVASLIVGIALFVGGSALAHWRTSRQVLGARLGIVAVTLAVVGLVGGEEPASPLAIVAAGLLAVVVVEGLTVPSRHPAPPAEAVEPAGRRR